MIEDTCIMMTAVEGMHVSAVCQRLAPFFPDGTCYSVLRWAALYEIELVHGWRCNVALGQMISVIHTAHAQMSGLASPS
jgi:hypothetical protein